MTEGVDLQWRRGFIVAAERHLPVERAEALARAVPWPNGDSQRGNVGKCGEKYGKIMIYDDLMMT